MYPIQPAYVYLLLFRTVKIDVYDWDRDGRYNWLTQTAPSYMRYPPWVCQNSLGGLEGHDRYQGLGLGSSLQSGPLLASGLLP